ncbi:phosphotriesterase [Kitasatospora sp. NBC_00240]|uniref:phosphotriesterase family protein n=1 Tax=Kitasatospora sp. NBC_00240 TaxID=2903567 RepID=UPI00224DF89F|nr:phosphotriesterase [Kitasatospora sp. NBC_00240]MCX5209557.1 phosphotriesterase [Kitasatospora sp. NBC_00240]
MSAVRTVLGDVDPALLGVCDAHDHLFLASPLLPGQELDDPAAAGTELRAFAAAGGRALVQWTPYGMGRGGAGLAGLSRATGVHLVAATGLHQDVHYDPAVLRGLSGVDVLARLFTEELTVGLRADGGGPAAGPSGVRAGLIKVAGGFHGLDGHARRVMTAAAEAHHATGAPIGVHHELGTGAPDVLDLLVGGLGVPPARVILGHLNRFPDLRLHRQVAESGAFLALDGPSRANHATDHHLFDTLAALVEAGHAGQLLLGGDTTTRAARGAPGSAFLVGGLAERITREFGADLTERLLVANPARAFAADWA